MNEVGVADNGDGWQGLESDNYRADYSKAKQKLKWEPRTKFDELVKIMVKKDIEIE